MSTEKKSKINKLLGSFPEGAVVLSSWLKEQGYNLDLQKRYRSSHWLESIGSGAMIRSGDQVTYSGAIYSLQNQAHSNIHPGARTALSLLGKSHYLMLNANSITLFGGRLENLPTWFAKKDWGYSIYYYSTNFLPADLGLTEIEHRNLKLKISNATRAMMECLYLAPKKLSLQECYELMEGLNNLRPAQVQPILEQCTSVKVKRLFLYLAEKAKHEWVKYLQIEKIDLGKGKRSIIKGGDYNAKYKITVEKGMEVKV